MAAPMRRPPLTRVTVDSSAPFTLTIRSGWANAGDFIWFMNRNGPKKRAAGGSLQDWSILTPTASIGSAAAGGAGSLTGTYQVYVTFVNATEGESNPSEGIEVTLTANA